VISKIATGFPGYKSVIGKDSATIGRILLENGYKTAWEGKNHNTPVYQTSTAGPFDHWPTGMGFSHFGFLSLARPSRTRSTANWILRHYTLFIAFLAGDERGMEEQVA
jgi:arylsulfatase A-like enzyme